MELDLAQLPQGQTYEDRYQGYLKVFEAIAKVSQHEEVRVYNYPWCWFPLLYHLNCKLDGAPWFGTPHIVFEHCNLVQGVVKAAIVPHTYDSYKLDRTAIEVLCSFRPETADALWKCDMQWKPLRVRKYEPKKEFIVTTNGAYHRPEVLDFIRNHLELYIPVKRKVLLVPCAADKPYPSPLHKACLEIMPDDFYLCNATGVLGLVPQALWKHMPWYDSGIPNQWRLYQVAKKYFDKFRHEQIVVYGDFYNYTLFEALRSIGQLEKTRFVLPPIKYDDYENLLSKENLDKLRATFGKGPSDAEGVRTP